MGLHFLRIKKPLTYLEVISRRHFVITHYNSPVFDFNDFIALGYFSLAFLAFFSHKWWSFWEPVHKGTCTTRALFT